MWRTPAVILACGALVLTISMGIRQSFGLFLEPVSIDMGWDRQVFGLAMAVQNLLMGASQPFFGALADRWGSARVVVIGGALYVAGLLTMAVTATPWDFQLSTGVLIGFATSATGFPVILGAVARAFPPEKRSVALGIAGAGGSFGQFAVAPASPYLIAGIGWPLALVALACLAGLMVPLAAALMRRPGEAAPQLAAGPVSLRGALHEAGYHGGYWLLNAGFFVCGFHVAFIAIHLPGYITYCGLPGSLSGWAIGMIGLFNMAGSYLAGVLGGRFRKKAVLSGIYFARAVVIAIFVMVPPSEISVLVFSAAIGFLWLSTVPLTSGLVGQIFGLRHMGMLFGIVLFSHQIGAFFGAWYGAFVYDTTGSYDLVWYVAIALGLFAAVVHLPIADRPLRQPA